MTVVDIEQPRALVGYLRAEGHLHPNERAEVRALGGGVSCKTVLVGRTTGPSWVLKQALPRLRVEADWFSDPDRIHVEALAMQWLPRLAPAGSIVPLVFEDRAQHLVAMEAASDPHEQWKTMLLAGRLNRSHVRDFAGLLAAIHTRSREIAEIAEVFARTDFFDQLRLEAYYAYAGEQVPQCRRFLADLSDATRRNRVCLTHGDFSPKNVLVTIGDRLVLLDHEVVHWGDGAFDIGFATSHLLAKALHLSDLRDDFLAAARLFWQAYVGRTAGPMAGARFEAQASRHLIACLLARVAGRSPLEYLRPEERRVQRSAAAELAAEPPATVRGVIEGFASLID